MPNPPPRPNSFPAVATPKITIAPLPPSPPRATVSAKTTLVSTPTVTKIPVLNPMQRAEVPQPDPLVLEEAKGSRRSE